jgi:hypothetical protein
MKSVSQHGGKGLNSCCLMLGHEWLEGGGGYVGVGGSYGGKDRAEQKGVIDVTCGQGTSSRTAISLNVPQFCVPSLRLMKHHTMKACGEEETQIHPFLITILDGGR